MSPCLLLCPHRSLPTFLAAIGLIALTSIRSKASGALWAGLLGLGGALGSAPPAHADTFVVTTTSDHDDGTCDADCTLREAIAAANAQPGDDVITFAGGVIGTLHLLGALPDLISNVEIQGPGAEGLVISRFNTAEAYRIFTVTQGSTVTLGGLTISNGESTRGGGIYNAGTLTIESSTLSGNTATGDFSGSFGGGIYNADTGTLTVRHTTLDDNMVSNDDGDGLSAGGGIYNAGTLTVTSSTLSSNTATGVGTINLGGGLFNAQDATLTIESSTLSGNTAADGGAADGGGIYNGGTLTVTSSTLSGNTTVATRGGGILNGGTLTLGNTILDRGTSGNNLVSLSLSFATVISQGYNLSDDDGGGHLTATGDQIDTEPLLGALADNGGPTHTHLPQTGSPAIDRGNTSLTEDQRGIARPQDFNALANATGGDGSDIGAVEVEAPADQQSGGTLVVNTTEDIGANACTETHCTLREAILTVNTDPDASLIIFDAVVFAVPRTITLNGSELLVDSDVTLTGPAAGVTISGDDASRVFNVNSGVVTFDGLTIRDGLDAFGGGILLAQNATLTVQNSTITDNAAAGFGGGGLFNLGGTLTIENSTFSGNTATGGGGLVNGGTLTIENSTFSGNTATTGNGGGILNAQNATLAIERSTLSGNATSSFGGGLANTSGTLTMTGSTLSGNTAGFGGGLFSRTDTDLTTTFSLLQNSTFSGNSASSSGGAIHNDEGQTTVESSTMTGNRAPVGNGGGLASAGDAGTRTVVTGTIVAGNLQPGGSDGTDVDWSNGTTNSFESGGYNLIGDGDAAGTFTGAGDQTGVADPGLGPLADNGGPTLTHLPQPGSPAIDQGKSTLPSDQRGQGRPTDSAAHANADGGDGSDIGAVELTQAELPGTAGLAVAVTLWLEGGYDASASQMRTDLSGVLPETDPYGLGASVAAGFFTTDPTGERVVDWMHLQLRTGDPATAMTVEAEQAVLLLDDGTLVAADGTALTFDVVPGSYWFVALHRNHLGVMSSQPLDCTSGSCTLDFTAAGSAFGTEAQAELAADVFGLFSGDYDGNGEVTISDFTTYQNAFTQAIADYEAADGNLDGEVTTADFTAYQNAFIQAVASQVPTVGSAPTFTQAAGGQR